MKTLRFHFVIVVLCCFSFLLLAGKFTFRKENTGLNAYEKPVTKVRDIPANRIMNMKEFKNISSP